MTKRSLTLLFTLPVLSWAGSAHAAGYAFWEQGAAATGRAGAMVADTTDPSLGFYNPAGLSTLGGTRLSFGGTYTLPQGGYTNPNGTSVDRTTRGIFPPNLHLYHGVKDKWAVGLSVFNAFGLGIDWPCQGAGRLFPGCTRIDRVDLKTPTLQPTFSWKFSKEFSIGVGVSITVASAELERNVGIAPFPTGRVLLGADGAVGVGGNIGFLYSPMSNLRFGLHYRSAQNLSFSGKAHFTFDPSIPASVRASLPSDQSGSLELTTPHVIAAGIAYDVTPRFTIELDVLQYFWRSFEELRLKFGPPPSGGNPVVGNCTPAGTQPGEQHVCSPRAWYDTAQFRLGVEWRPTPAFTLRGGYIFDLTPVPSRNLDPVLPDANRHDFSLGIGYQFSPLFRIDFAYMLVYFTPRDVVNDTSLFFPGETQPGKYEGLAHLMSLNLGFNF